MKFYNFSNLNKLLYIIDIGLIDTLKSNVRPQKESFYISIYKNIRSKFDDLLFSPLKLVFMRGDNGFEIKKNWLIYETLNNYKALYPLKSDKNIFVKPNETVIYRFLFFYKLIYVLPLIIWLLKKSKLKWFFMYYGVLGLVEESERLIKKYKPKKIIFANDINPYQVALKIAAKNRNIPTFYFQHACISEFMPPLDFDVAFLEGQDSLEKYKKIGKIRSKIELIGMMKYQYNNLKPNVNKQVKRIGLAINLLDSIEDITKTVHIIISKFPFLDIYIRKHPRDSRKINISNKKIAFSDSKNEDVFSFIGKIDLIIAGDSSIHLEAALLNVVPVYYRFTNVGLFDVYNFVENGLVYYAKDGSLLCNYIEKQLNNKSDVIKRTKYYDEHIRSKVDYKTVLKKYDI